MGQKYGNIVMIIITDYELIGDEKNVVCISREQTAKCPICDALLYPRDTKKRIMKKYGGICIHVCIRRLKCRECGKLHSELPDILIPYKHYAAEVIKNVVDEIVTAENLITEDYPCEETMKRWRQWIQRSISHINMCLNKAAKEYYLKFFKGCKSPRLEDIRKWGAGWLAGIAGIIYCSGDCL